MHYAVQSETAILDDRLERIVDLAHTDNLGSGFLSHLYTHTTDRPLAVFGYRHTRSGLRAYTLWQTDNIPADLNDLRAQEIGILGGSVEQSVWVDVISGAVHDVPASQWERKGETYRFKGIPVHDAAVALADQRVIPLNA
jgi:hypothetical protein